MEKLQASPLRVLQLTARAKACEHPDKACHGESCPLARGFYDRLPAAREAAVALPRWDKDSLRTLAAEHAVCPYYLTQELARWADVIVGDYNHGFDVAAFLPALAEAQGWKVGLLVDEAHNLVDRARKMYTAELDPRQFKAVRAAAPAALKKPLNRVGRAWKALDAAQEADYQLHEAPPSALLNALQQASGDILELAGEQPEGVPPALMDWGFEALHFTRLAEAFGEHSLFDGQRDGGGLRLTLRNVVPAPFLKARFAALHSATLFSATLQPPDYHREMLGLPDNSAWLAVASPFAAEQLRVRVARRISTRWQHRQRSVAPIAQLIAAQFSERPGNYLAFFSSFDYLEAALAALTEVAPQLPLWAQRRGMSEAEQAAFLARFAPGGQGVGFAVLGGAFAEGVDLPGDRLIGAFIATLGLPQVNPVNEQFRLRIEALHPGRGFDFVYLYPGLQKVVQAAGRVIRSESDRGVLHLMDDRFARPDVQDLLPQWWHLSS
jgi:Rad3-related DNA helicase